MKKTEITNRVAVVREQHGLSATELAKAVGVSRQTIYAVEAGSYIPNTAIGLRLAQTLGVTLDHLFTLASSAIAPDRAERATLLPSGNKLEPGQAVQLCRVNEKLIAMEALSDAWCLPSTDGFVASIGGLHGSARVQVTSSADQLSNRILLAGCDPAMGMLRRHLQAAGIEVILAHRNSSQSLLLLKNGLAHIAGSHLASNSGAIRKVFASKVVNLIGFATWQEGLATLPGNPKAIKGVEDFGRRDVKIVNREQGSGSRALLDRYLLKLDVDAARVKGYSRMASGHLAAACEVKTCGADCCISTEAAARFYGLNFIPLETVRYDLAVRRQQLGERAVQVFFDSLSQLAFRKKLAGLGGYDTTVTTKSE